MAFNGSTPQRSSHMRAGITDREVLATDQKDSHHPTIDRIGSPFPLRDIADIGYGFKVGHGVFAVRGGSRELGRNRIGPIPGGQEWCDQRGPSDSGGSPSATRFSMID